MWEEFCLGAWFGFPSAQIHVCILRAITSTNIFGALKAAPSVSFQQNFSFILSLTLCFSTLSISCYLFCRWLCSLSFSPSLTLNIHLSYSRFEFISSNLLSFRQNFTLPLSFAAFLTLHFTNFLLLYLFLYIAVYVSNCLFILSLALP